MRKGLLLALTALVLPALCVAESPERPVPAHVAEKWEAVTAELQKDAPQQAHVSQVVLEPNRGGSDPDPKLLMQIEDSLPFAIGSLSCNSQYPPAYSFQNQNSQKFELLSLLQNSGYYGVITQQLFTFRSTPDNYLSGWNVFSATWKQVGWYCDAQLILVAGQDPDNPIADTKTAKCFSDNGLECTTPDFEPSEQYSLVLAIGVATGPGGNPYQGFIGAGEGCQLTDVGPLGTIVEICQGSPIHVSAEFGYPHVTGMLTAFAIR